MAKTTSSKNDVKDKQIVGNIGMYYICYLLSTKGWNAMPTARNAKGIDIVAYSEDGRCITIQVKTFSYSKNMNITTFKKEEKIIWNYLFVVLLSDAPTPQSGKQTNDKPIVYILSKDEIEKDKLLENYKKEGKKEYICLTKSKYAKGKQHLFDNVWAKIDNK